MSERERERERREEGEGEGEVGREGEVGAKKGVID